MHHHVFEVQLNLLSATYLKQQWMLPKIVDKYIALSQALLEDGATAIKVFQDDVEYDLTAITSQCKWHEINAKTLSIRTKLLKNNVKLLTHVLKLIGTGGGDDDRLQLLCTECVLKVFQFSTLPTKNTCLRYFYQLSSGQASKWWPDQHLTLLIILVGTARVFNELFSWQRDRLVSDTDVQQFYRSATSFLRLNGSLLSSLSTNHRTTVPTDVITSIIDTCWPLLQNKNATTNADDAEIKLSTSVCRFLMALLASGRWTGGDDAEDADDYHPSWLRKRLLFEIKAVNKLTSSILELFEFEFDHELRLDVGKGTPCLDAMRPLIDDIVQRTLKCATNDLGSKC